MRAPLITLTTDFGSEDAYVAQMKGQILSICPDARLVDITHAIPAQDVFRAAFVLSQSAPYFPSHTIHLVVVDPGVGTDRSMLAVEVDTHLDSPQTVSRQRFVLPDNGLISPLAARYGIVRAIALTQSRYWRPRVSATFHGRDIMGPVAAHWAAGVTSDLFGPAVAQFQSLRWPQPEYLPGEAHGEIIVIDHFGNALTNVPGDWLVNSMQLDGYRNRFDVEVSDRSISLEAATTYGEQPAGTPVLLIGSHDMVELAIVGGSAARELDVRVGSSVCMRMREGVLPREHSG